MQSTCKLRQTAAFGNSVSMLQHMLEMQLSILQFKQQQLQCGALFVAPLGVMTAADGSVKP